MPVSPAGPEVGAHRAPVTLVHVTTVPLTLGFLRGQAAFMCRHGIETEVISSAGVGLEEFVRSEGVLVHVVQMERRISPIRDLGALVRLVRVLRRIRPDIVHAHTPKGGLLGTIASHLAGVPVTIYHIHGLPLVTAAGFRKWVLRWSDWLACHLADRILCVSASIREIVIASGLAPADRVRVLLKGSINGVDADGRFNPDQLSAHTRAAIRAEAGIPVDARVVGFVGRIVGDKGIRELVEAWSGLAPTHRDAHLLLVGPFEPQDPLPAAVEEQLRTDPRIHLAGLRWDTPQWLSAMDVVVLPTYREGLPVVPLEAAAMGLPVVATRVPGCVDAVEDGVTGTLVPVRDTAALAQAIAVYLDDPALRWAHGRAGRERVVTWFSPEAMWDALLKEYRSLLPHRGTPT